MHDDAGYAGLSAADREGLQTILGEVDCLALALVANSVDCVKILDLEGTLLFMSEAGRCAMEIEDFEPLRGAFWTAFWTKDVRRLADGMIANAAQGRISRFTASCPTATGRFRVWDVTIAPIMGKGGAITTIARLLAVSRDVTDLWRSGLRPEAMIGHEPD